MYFQSFDTFHIIIASLFLIITLGFIFFRYKKNIYLNKKTINYTTNHIYLGIRITSLFIAIIFLVGTLFAPVNIIKNSSSSLSGIDCIWILDVSTSMDAVDVTSDNISVSRLTKAKSIIENYILSHPENRYGLVIFAGKSRLISPLTQEHSSLLSFLVSIDSKSISEGGTDFQQALSLVTERFESKDISPRAVVLLSDGGDNEEIPQVSSIKNLISGKNIHLIAVGIGESKPSPIPIGRNPFGDIVYKKFNGETVLTKLNKTSLKEISIAGKGVYFDGNSLENKINSSLKTIARKIFSESKNGEIDISIQIFGGISFFFFLLFIFIPSSFLKQGNDL